MSEEKKINGWIAQYKEEDSARYAHENYKHVQVALIEGEIVKAFEGRKGWRIRPVKLVFLDEPTEQEFIDEHQKRIAPLVEKRRKNFKLI